MIGILLFSAICLYLLFRFIIFVINHARLRRSFAHFPQMPSNFFLGETKFFTKFPINRHFVLTLNNIADNFVHKEKLFLSWMGIQPIVFIFNRDYIKQILSKTDSPSLKKGAWFYNGIDDIAPNGLLTVPGDPWRVRRKILSQPFSHTNLDNFEKIVKEESGKLIAKLKKNPVCKDVINETNRLMLSSFAKLLFEYDLSDEIDETVRLASRVTNLLVSKAFSLFLVSPFAYRFTSVAKEEIEALKELMNFKKKLLGAKTEISKETLKSKLETQTDLDTKASNLTLIEILLKNFVSTLQKKTAEWSGFEMDEIKAQLDTFIVAGFDTLSAATLFDIYHLAMYPNYQQQIYDEIQQVLGPDHKGPVTIEQVKKMVFLEAFVNESLRIQPVAPIISRNAAEDIKFGDYLIPKGTDIVIFIEKTLRDPDYFPEPDKFKPERYLEDQTQNLYANIAFSAGIRNCVAKKISVHFLQLIVCEFVRNFKINPTASTPREIPRNMLKFELANKPVMDIELEFVTRQKA